MPIQNGSTKPSKAQYHTALYRDPPVLARISTREMVAPHPWPFGHVCTAMRSTKCNQPAAALSLYRSPPTPASRAQCRRFLYSQTPLKAYPTLGITPLYGYEKSFHRRCTLLKIIKFKGVSLFQFRDTEIRRRSFSNSTLLKSIGD